MVQQARDKLDPVRQLGYVEQTRSDETAYVFRGQDVGDLFIEVSLKKAKAFERLLPGIFEIQRARLDRGFDESQDK